MKKQHIIIYSLLGLMGLGLLMHWQTSDKNTTYTPLIHSIKQMDIETDLLNQNIYTNEAFIEDELRKHYWSFDYWNTIVPSMIEFHNDFLTIVDTAQNRLMRASGLNTSFESSSKPNCVDCLSPVQKILIEEKQAEKIVEQWQKTFVKLKELNQSLSDSISTNLDLVQQLEAKNETVLNKKNILNNLAAISKFKKQLQKMDTGHALLYLATIAHEASLLTNKLTMNVADCIYSFPLEEQYRYTPVVSFNETAKVGKPFRADIYILRNHRSDSIKVKVNNRPITVKEGVGYFEYTPTRRGKHSFTVDFNTINPFTGESLMYKKTFQAIIY